ncbi:MAG: hypothetical protein KC505_04310 [Myxococcales bacterium]|nr:hypothetical protein [Myxococcales bacterium]USN50228.1 MAG: hypothetical protein H6731_08140 [Myxococcales bacterium]
MSGGKLFQNISINLLLMCCAQIIIAAQDDNSLIFRGHFPAVEKKGVSFLNSFASEANITRYLIANQHHVWRARVMSDVGLINFSPSVLWHTGLTMETLVDNQNDINFRLVQVYYQVLTAFDWNLGDQSFRFGYRHRCSHGTDGAVSSRITIRSGPTLVYQKNWLLKHANISIEPGTNLYLIGQNSDLMNQLRGELFFNSQVLFPVYNSLSLLFVSGINFLFNSEGNNFLYFPFSPLKNWEIIPLWGARLALRVEPGRIKSDIGLAYRQNFDSSLGHHAEKLHLLSLELNFMW